MNTTFQLSKSQQEIVERPAFGRIFLEGAAGTGKTTAAVARLLNLLQSGVPADSVLVLTPQRTVALNYLEALRRAELPPGGQVRVTSMSGIAREMVSLYWQVVAPRAGFALASTPPTFLNLETSQYVMARVVHPLLADDGYFETVTIPRGRLYSQLLDNLNKAAIVGFPYTEVASRLKPAWAGETAAARMFDEVQDAANKFRAYCLEHNLLDFSLLIDTFMRHTLPVCADLLFSRATHLIFDNVEEDTYAAHQLMEQWLQRAESALVVFDTEAGYRRFLGADEDSASSLRAFCDESIEFTESVVASENVQALTAAMAPIFNEFAEATPGDPLAGFDYEATRFFPEMLDWATRSTADLIASGVPPSEIALLAPFMSDALRFSLLERLRALGVPARSHRPSRSLRDEPVVRAMLTLAKLAHPAWSYTPDVRDVAHALMAALSANERGGLDLARAHMLTTAVYPYAESASRLAPFETMPAEIQERITYTIGEKYDQLREWMENFIREGAEAKPEEKPKKRRKKNAPPPAPMQPALDHFFSRLFGEVLSARGFGLHRDLIAADAIAALVDSARNFRRTLERMDANRTETSTIVPSAGREYVEMVTAGVIANQGIGSWLRPEANAVLVAPAYTFLMNNRPAAHQFWLDVGGRGWSERVYQPLTHPYVLSRGWSAGSVWTDEDEFEYRRDALFRLVTGLLRRCRDGVHLGITELGETGTESNGLLLEAFNRLLRRLSETPTGDQGNPDGI